MIRIFKAGLFKQLESRICPFFSPAPHKDIVWPGGADGAAFEGEAMAGGGGQGALHGTSEIQLYRRAGPSVSL